MQLPRNALEVVDVTLIFNVREEGMHLKIINQEENWHNVWPSNGLFPENELRECEEALLISCEKVSQGTGNAVTICSSTINSAICSTVATNTYFGRRGNGARPVPTHNKRKFNTVQSNIPPKQPLTQTETKSFMKNITITHIDENNDLETMGQDSLNLLLMMFKKR